MECSTIPDDMVLSNMNLEGQIPEAIGRVPKLRVLHLDGNQLNSSIPANFGNMENLSELRLDGNKLTGAIPFNREMIWRMRRKLRVNDNPGLCYDARAGLGHDLSTLFENEKEAEDEELLLLRFQS